MRRLKWSKWKEKIEEYCLIFEKRAKPYYIIAIYISLEMEHRSVAVYKDTLSIEYILDDDDPELTLENAEYIALQLLAHLDKMPPIV